VAHRRIQLAAKIRLGVFDAEPDVPRKWKQLPAVLDIPHITFDVPPTAGGDSFWTACIEAESAPAFPLRSRPEPAATVRELPDDGATAHSPLGDRGDRGEGTPGVSPSVAAGTEPADRDKPLRDVSPGDRDEEQRRTDVGTRRSRRAVRAWTCMQ